MKEQVVYLAGPIGYVPVEIEERKVHWRRAAIQAFSDAGVATYDPLGAINPGVATLAPTALREINLLAMTGCTGLLAAVLDCPSWGTPVEIFRARETLPVVLWKPDEELLTPPYFADLPIVSDLDAAVQALVGMMDHPVESVDEMLRQIQAALHAPSSGELREPALQTEFDRVWKEHLEDGHPPLSQAEVDALRWEGQYPLYATVDAIAEPKLEGDVGYDIRLMHGAVIPPGTFVKLPVGDAEQHPLQVAIPEGCWGTFLSRSSMAAQGFLVQQTVVDPGYRGPLYAFAYYAGTEPLVLNAGQRVAQLVLFPSVTPPLELVDELPDSERGERGFGSTGED